MEAGIRIRLMKEDISNKHLKDFGILIGFGFPIFIGWLIPLISGHFFKIWTLYISLPVLILAFLKPSLLFFPYKAWMQLGYLLGWINSRIILGIIFLVVVQPIAFDFYAKTVPRAPIFMRKNSLEWLFRVYKEPKRLFLRYFFSIPLFVIGFTMQLFDIVLRKI